MKDYQKNETVTISLERYQGLIENNAMCQKVYERRLHDTELMREKLIELGYTFVYETGKPTRIMLKEDWDKSEEGMQEAKLIGEALEKLKHAELTITKVVGE